MNGLNVAAKAQAIFAAKNAWDATAQQMLGSFVAAALAYSLTRQTMALGTMGLNSSETTAMAAVITSGSDDTIATALVNAITNKRAAQAAYSTSDLATFRNSVHAGLKASVEGHTELGTMTYEGERKDYASNLMTKLELKISVINDLPPQPGRTAAENTTFNTERASQLQKANTDRDVNYLVELIDSAIMIKYPFKTVAAGTGFSKAITLKQSVNGVGPGTKKFFWMHDETKDEDYGWQIDGKDVDRGTFYEVKTAWEEAAAATDTAIEAANQGVLNAAGDVADVAGDVAEAVKSAVEAKIEDPFGTKALMNTLMGLLTMAAVIAAIGIGGYFAWKYLIKPRVSPETPDITAGIPTNLDELGAKVETMQAKTEAAQAKMDAMQQRQIQRNVQRTIQPVGTAVGGATQAVTPVLDVAEQHPETTKIATQAGMAAATGGTSEIGPAMAGMGGGMQGVPVQTAAPAAQAPQGAKVSTGA